MCSPEYWNHQKFTCSQPSQNQMDNNTLANRPTWLVCPQCQITTWRLYPQPWIAVRICAIRCPVRATAPFSFRRQCARAVLRRHLRTSWPNRDSLIKVEKGSYTSPHGCWARWCCWCWSLEPPREFLVRSLNGRLQNTAFLMAAAAEMLHMLQNPLVLGQQRRNEMGGKREKNRYFRWYFDIFLGRQTIVKHIWDIFSRWQKEKKKRRNSHSFYCSSSQSCWMW